MVTEQELRELTDFAQEIRIWTIRQMAERGFGHMGGTMSICDLLSVLYGKRMKVCPEDPSFEERDWLVCSKGHAGPAVYAALALKGFFPKEWLYTLNQPGTRLPSHCDAGKTPGIDVTTGSLGQGLSAACGVALAKKLDERKERVYCIIGDGESQEGQNWEAAMFAAQNRLGNLTLFVDNNKKQLDNDTEKICDMEDFEEKFKSFGWHTVRVNGHDCRAIDDAVGQAIQEQERPTAVILDTLKGKGCKFAETIWNHHINVTGEQAKEAIEALMA